eukprot:1612021-Pleurochrysis_carterae.AAC.4
MPMPCICCSSLSSFFDCCRSCSSCRCLSCSLACSIELEESGALSADTRDATSASASLLHMLRTDACGGCDGAVAGASWAACGASWAACGAS